MERNEASLKSIILESNEGAIIRFFEPLEAKERRRYHPVVKELLRDLSRRTRENNAVTVWTDAVSRVWGELNELRPRVSLALLFTGTNSEILARKSLPDDVGGFIWRKVDGETFENHPLVRTIKLLKPTWADAFIENALSREFFAWPIVFFLFRDGCISRPSHASFYSGIFSFGASATRGWAHQKTYEFLEDHHELLVPAIHHGLVLPEAEKLQRYDLERGEHSLPLRSKQKQQDPRHSSWSYAICRTTDLGLIDRDQMSETIFTGLAMHAKPSICKWLFELFDRLWPELRDRLRWVQREDLGFVHALSAPSSNTRIWALKHLDTAFKHEAVSAENLLGHLPQLLQSDRKNMVTKGLTLLGKIAKKRADLRPSIAEVACDALLMEEVTVQKRVLKIVQDNSDPQDATVREAATTYTESIVPSLRGDFLPWIGDQLLDLAAVESETFNPISPPDPLSACNRIEPIVELDEFIAQLSFWFQNPAESELLHRLLDSFGFNNDYAAEEIRRRSEALTKLMNSHNSSFAWDGYGHHTMKDVAKLVEAWQGTAKVGNKLIRGLGRLIGKLPMLSLGEGLLGHYGGMICRHIATERNFQLLSSPTHTGGWIDPIVFVERTLQSKEFDPTDVQIAMLRLAPSGRREALAYAQQKKAGKIVRFALGDEGVKPEKNDAMWLSAIRSRHPHSDVPELHDWNQGFDEPDALHPAQYKIKYSLPRKMKERGYRGEVLMTTPEVSVSLDRRNGKRTLPYSRRQFNGGRLDWWGGLAEHDFAAHQWNCSVWPANRRPFFRLAINQLSNAVEMAANQFYTKSESCYMRWLTLPPHDLDELGHLALVMGLNSAFQTTRQAAVDASIQNINCDLVCPNHLGHALKNTLAIHFIKMNRLIPSLKEIISASTRHSEVVCQALGIAPDLGKRPPPRLFNQLLELLTQLRVRHNGTELAASARGYLENLEAKGKTKSLIRQLLAS